MFWKLQREITFIILFLLSAFLVGRESGETCAVETFNPVEYEHALSRELLLENQRLRNLHGISPHPPLSLAGTGRVVSVDPHGYPSWIIVETGAGVLPGEALTVIDPGGRLVGRVMEKKGSRLTVMTILSPQSTLSVVLQESRNYGILKSGGLPSRLSVEYVENRAAVMPGEMVLTSRLSQFFPPGIPAGRVRRAEATRDLFQRISVSPAADFSRLEEVVIVY